MNRLAEWRRKADISQKKLAEDSNCSQAYICQLEQGTRSEPGLSRGRRIVEALVAAGAECTLDDVFPPAAEDNEAA